MADEHVNADALGTDGDSSSGKVGRRGGQTLPLNSRCLTAALLRQLAVGLGVPSTASQGDLCLIIEGKLSEAGHEPLPTQVVLQEKVRSTLISL